MYRCESVHYIVFIYKRYVTECRPAEYRERLMTAPNYRLDKSHYLLYLWPGNVYNFLSKNMHLIKPK